MPPGFWFPPGATVASSTVCAPPGAYIGCSHEAQKDTAVRQNARVLGLLSVMAGGALLLAACGGSDNNNNNGGVTAQQACDALAGKTLAGTTLTAATVAASGPVPTYCKLNGTIAPKLNFEMRLPQTWNG